MKKFNKNIKQLSKLRSYRKKKLHFSYLDNKFETDPSEDDNDSSTSESEDSDTGSISVKSEFWKMKQETRRLEVRQDRKKAEADLVNTFNNISAETTQLMAINDIKVEAEMVLSILSGQLRVIEDFAESIKHSQSIPQTAHTRLLLKMVEDGKKQQYRLEKMRHQSTEIFESVYRPPFCGDLIFSLTFERLAGPPFGLEAEAGQCL